MDPVTPPVGAARGAFDLRGLVGDAGLVIGAALAANLLNYAFHFIVSRRLGPDQYGTLTALIAIAALVGVIGSALNGVAVQEAARLWVDHRDDDIGAFVRYAAPAAFGVAAVVAAGILIASLALAPYLHIEQWDLWIAFAAYCAANVFASFLRGCAQGAHRFRYFAASLIGEAIVKLIVAVALVSAGWHVLGALAGFVAGITFAAGVLVPPFIARTQSRTYDVSEHSRMRLGGESLKVLGVGACTAALMFIDTIFAKHQLSGDEAGYYGAAGTIARIIPYGVGLIGLVLMPKAAAAHHASRESLSRLLTIAFGAGLLVTGVVVALLVGAPNLVIAASYGARFEASIPLLRLYAIDEGILGACTLGFAYLVAVRDYRVARFLVPAVLLEAALMAVFGKTPVALLSIAIAVNAALVPGIAMCVAQALRTAPAIAHQSLAPQAPNPPSAEV
jgi:O-antigen/teichoic acid export membrane protein